MKLYSKLTLHHLIACIFCMILLLSQNSWGQQLDSIKISWKTRTKKASRIPEIKANIQPYHPFYSSISGYNYLGGYSAINQTTVITPKDKLLTILKIYPNPVNDQLNLVLAINRENLLVTINILDLLGNEVITLSNEKLPLGEQTKSFAIPSRMKPGIYFLRIVAGSESQIKRISVL